jgi:hypothetical protein
MLEDEQEVESLNTTSTSISVGFTRSMGVSSHILSDGYPFK